MGYALYEISRNGETIQAGYGVDAVCEQTGCTAEIDRGLGYLCGSCSERWETNQPDPEEATLPA